MLFMYFINSKNVNDSKDNDSKDNDPVNCEGYWNEWSPCGQKQNKKILCSY